MNEKMSKLMQRRIELLVRIAAQREQMSEIEADWRAPLALADQGVAAVRFLRCHPLLVAGVVAFLVVRRRGVAGLVRGLWQVWKGYRYYNFLSAKFLSRS
ncbi:MAG: YqjK-like family protein [Gallionella sp.]